MNPLHREKRITFKSSVLAFHLFIKRRIDRIEILAVEMILRDAKGIAKALIMHDLALAQIFDGIAHIRIVAQAKDIVVGHARLLLCYYHVFATFFDFQKPRKILIFQGFSALLELPIFQKFQ